MNHHDYAAALFSNKERDITWQNPLALGEVSVVVETKLLKHFVAVYKGLSSTGKAGRLS